MFSKSSFTLFLIYLTCLFSTVFSALSPEELQQLQGDHGIIHLNSDNFGQILNGPRDYFLSLLFTTTAEHIPCDTCKKFDPQYKIVSKSYFATNPGRNDLFFLVAEFGDNESKFRELKMDKVPKLWIFPPTSKEWYNVTSPHYQYTISEAALNDPLDFADFIAKAANLSIVIQPDFELSQFFTYFLGTFFFVLILKKQVLGRINKAVVLKFLVVFATIVLISGYMFTVIRGIPLIAKDDKGNIMYFSGGTHWQFGLETFIISSIYIALGALIVGLVSYIPLIENEQLKNSLTIGFAFGVLYIFNYLTKIFLVKDPGYPYQVTNWL